MDKNRTSSSIEANQQDENTLLAAGTTVGAIGAAGVLLTGAVCPLCIIATPLLVGAGLWKKVKRRYRKVD